MDIDQTLFQRDLRSANLGSAYAKPKRRFIPANDLRRTVQVLVRCKWIVFGSICSAFIIALSLILFSKPLYTASVDLILESPSQPVFDATDPANNELRNEAELFNEIVAIQSRGLASRVIDKLNLTDDPEYNAKLWPKGLLAKFTNDLLGTKNNNSSGAKNEDEHTKAKIIDSFLGRLQVQNVPRSRALEVSFTSVDPKKAAAIANSIAEEYIEAKLDSRFESVQRASAWLADRVQSLRAQLTQSEKAVENYRSEHNLYEDGGSTLVARQISDLNSKSIDAKMELIAAEANFAEARRLLNSPGSMGTTAVQVLQSDTIRQFREQELQLDRKVAEMSNQYGMRHPAMVQVQAQRQELRNKIREEIERITKSLENQVRIAQTREASLARDLDELKTKQAKLDHALLGLRVLERNAEANRLILQKMMASSIEASAQNDIASQVAGARVVSPAAVPDRPSFPPNTKARKNITWYRQLSPPTDIFNWLITVIPCE